MKEYEFEISNYQAEMKEYEIKIGNCQAGMKGYEINSVTDNFSNCRDEEEEETNPTYMCMRQLEKEAMASADLRAGRRLAARGHGVGRTWTSAGWR